MSMTVHLDCSEILPNHLIVGAAPTRADIHRLRALGVDAVLSILHESDPYRVPDEVRQAFDWAQIDVVDSYFKGLPTPADIAEAVALMRAWRAEGRTIYLHCLMGQGRSPLMAMAYLVAGNDEERDPRAHRLTAAIAQVRQARGKADPNVHQLKVLCEFVQGYLESQGHTYTA